jgi:formate-nitrite transporter family protein
VSERARRREGKRERAQEKEANPDRKAKERASDERSGSGPDVDVAKTSEQILDEEVWHGLEELRRPAPGLLISGLSAGLDIGFSAFFMGVVLTTLDADASALLTRALTGGAYAIGFIFVVLGRSALFTEHTALAVFPVLRGSASLAELGRLWFLVYVSNLVGAALFAAFAVVLGPRLGVVEPWAFVQIASHLVDHEPFTILLSATAAGWLIGLLSWLVAASQETLARVVVVALITFAIGFAGLHHSIVGSVEVLTGVFSGEELGARHFAYFLGWTTLGNIVGGVALVAILKYGHAVRSPIAS